MERPGYHSLGPAHRAHLNQRASRPDNPAASRIRGHPAQPGDNGPAVIPNCNNHPHMLILKASQRLTIGERKILNDFVKPFEPSVLE